MPAVAESVTALLQAGDPNMGTISGPIQAGDGFFWVEGTEVSDDNWKLQVTAMQGSARRAIDVLVQASSGIPYGFFSREDLDLRGADAGGDVLFDSWDPEDGTYDSLAINDHDGLTYADDDVPIGSNGSITVDGDVHVFGNLEFGPEGEVIWRDETNSYVSSDIDEASDETYELVS